jgi:DNA-binding NtrC family response regulator
VPPLRERREDIPDLVNFFIQRDARSLGAENSSIQNDALALLSEQPWPGNVRELENAVRQALLFARPFTINTDHVRKVMAQGRKTAAALGSGYREYITDLLARVQRGEEQNAYARVIADLEPELFTQAYQLAQGNQGRAASLLGVTRLKMREKLKELGLHPKRQVAE